jgi:predicted enzyme related to lactoylglutathione lyase
MPNLSLIGARRRIVALALALGCVTLGGPSWSQETPDAVDTAADKPAEAAAEHHAPPFLGLRTVVYQVGDLKAATAWYTKVLDIEPYLVTDYYVQFKVGGFDLGLDPDNSGGPKGGVTAFWGVDNVEESLQRMLSLGATHHTDVNPVGGGVKLVTVLDPWGNIFGMMENPYFKSPTG